MAAGLTLAASGQTSSPLRDAKKLYVEPFGTGDQAEQLRQSLIKRLQKAGGYQLVDTRNDADAVVKGSGQVWVRGHFTTNPRAPGSSRSAIYGGFLSVEIVSHGGEPLWSYMVTPSRFAWKGIADDLASTMVSQLLATRDTGGASTNLSGAGATLQSTTLAGAGSTFAAPLYRKWFQSFRELQPQVAITYDAVGSVAGPQELAEGKVDFAATDFVVGIAPGTSTGMRYIPTVLGGVVPIYNLDGITRDLRFTPETLADIYMGKVRKWNDPEIRNSNRDIDLPDREIVVLHRSDGSGTTFAWSDFLSQVSSAWKDSVGSGASLNWPTGTGANGNEGVAAAVQATPNSIGYVELVYAIQHQLSYGSVRNHAGEYIRASIQSLAEAAKETAGSGDAFHSLAQPTGKDAYPITSFTWLLIPQAIDDPQKKAAFTALVHWILTSGQKECSALGYAPLPSEVAQRQLQLFEIPQ
jgi:phosphate ABC transporter phosphate-binding protein